jgi:5-methylthioadenosine/S-adenosylhomocysteine deaminase
VTVDSKYSVPPGPSASSVPSQGRDPHADTVTLQGLRRHTGGFPTVLLRGGYVVTMDTRLGNSAGDVLLRDGRIAAVGSDLGGAAAIDGCVVVDATNTIVMPGFVDSHVHAWEGQLRGVAPTVDFPTYRELILARFSRHYRPHDVYVGTIVTAVQALDGGVTTVVDNSHLARTPDHTRAAIEAMRDSGIRAVHAAGAPSFGDADAQFPRGIPGIRDEYGDSTQQLLTVRLYDRAVSEPLWRFARDHELWMSHETGTGMVAELEPLRRVGLLTEKHAFNHCAGLHDHDWTLIAQAGAQVNLAARSDTAFGIGPAHPPAEQAHQHGIRPGLSMDNEVSYGLDMFVEMQSLMASQRSRAFQSVLSGQPAHFPSIPEILEFATLGGAANAGLGHRVGSLTPGKDADVILVDTSSVAISGVNTAAATLLGFANRSHVDTVFVAGRVRKWRGALVEIDVPAIQSLAQNSVDHLIAASHHEHAYGW